MKSWLCCYSGRRKRNVDEPGVELRDLLPQAQDNYDFAKDNHIPGNYVPTASARDSRRKREEDGVYYMEMGQQWHILALTRQESIQLLRRAPTTTGKFLIRNCLSRPGQFALSVLNNRNQVLHYIISRVDHLYYVEDNKGFPTIRELVLYYRDNASQTVERLVIPCIIDRCEVQIPKELDTLVINRSNVEKQTLLGEGHFGKVFKGKLLGNIDVAIKESKEAINTKEFVDEAATMAALKHHRIVQFFGVVTEGGHFLIISELMSCGDLLNYLQQQGDNFRFVDKVTVIMQVADGMTYMESKKFIHRDLRAANILVGDKATYKIADFGLARFNENEEYNSIGSKFPVRWTAPEALKWKKYSHKSDVWSFGILLLEIATKGKRPYSGMSNQEVNQHVINGNFPEKPQECSDMLYDLMTNCWSKVAEERPNFVNLMDLLSQGLEDEPTFENVNVVTYPRSDRQNT